MKQEIPTGPDSSSPAFGQRFWESIGDFMPDDDRDEIKHAILGLLFLKQSSDLFEQRKSELEGAGRSGRHTPAADGASEHLVDQVENELVRIPEKASWKYLIKNAQSKNIATCLDIAMQALAEENGLWGGILPVSYQAIGL